MLNIGAKFSFRLNAKGANNQISEWTLPGGLGSVDLSGGSLTGIVYSFNVRRTWNSDLIISHNTGTNYSESKLYYQSLVKIGTTVNGIEDSPSM